MRTFNQDMVLVLKISFLAYLLDILTSKDLYKKCKYPVTNNIELYLHHTIFIFNAIGWLSNNKSILKLFIISSSITLLHTYKNKSNNCILTQQFNDDCEINNNFRSPNKFLGFNHSRGNFQIKFHIAAIIYALYKLTEF